MIPKGSSASNSACHVGKRAGFGCSPVAPPTYLTQESISSRRTSCKSMRMYAASVLSRTTYARATSDTSRGAGEAPHRQPASPPSTGRAPVALAAQ